MGWGNNPTDEAKADRWQEQWGHWDNIEAFMDHIAAVNKDRVIDKTEMDRICFLQPQWEAQLTAARDYVKEYRRIDPEFVAKNSGLEKLEEEAERGLQVVIAAQHDCR